MCNFMKYLILILCISILAGCKKDNPIETPVKSVFQEKNTWQRIDKYWNTDLNIKNSFVKDNILYLISDGALIAIDSNRNIVNSTPIFYKLSSAFFYRPTYNDRYVIQVNSDKRSIFVFEFENPQINKRILVDPSYSIDAFGQLNSSNELLIGLKTNKTILLTFGTNGNEITHTIDTISTSNTYSGIFSSGENHFMTSYDQWTVRYSNKSSTFESIGNFRISNLTTLNDTIYATLFWTNSSGDGLIFSTDKGITWSQLISNLRLDYYYIHKLQNDILFSFYRQVARLRFDFSKGTYSLSPINNSGLLDNMNQEEINSIVKLGDKVFASTSKGLYYTHTDSLE